MNENMNENKLKVIFIGSSGRSGSTLLEMLLGQIPGFFPVGELSNIWDRGFGENQLCSCGKPFLECDFWQAVRKEAFGNTNPKNTDEIYALRRSVARLRHIPLLLSPVKSPTYRRRLTTYKEIISKLYQAIQKVSGARIIVDASKEPSHGLLLSSIPNIELHVVHLIRDSRAVAFSWSRKKRRPEIYWKEAYMPQLKPWKAAWDWFLYNLGLQFLRWHSDSYTLIRYEKLATNPGEVLNKLLTHMGELKRSLDFLDGHRAKIQTVHTVSGNPLRFQQGIIEIRPDTEWQRKMKALDRYLVTLLTWPLLLYFGYFKRQWGDKDD